MPTDVVLYNRIGCFFVFAKRWHNQLQYTHSKCVLYATNAFRMVRRHKYTSQNALRGTLSAGILQSSPQTLTYRHKSEPLGQIVGHNENVQFHKPPTALLCTVKTEMHVIVHQHKRKDNNSGFPCQRRYHIHPIDFRVSVREHRVSTAAISVTMIAITDRLEEII